MKNNRGTIVLDYKLRTYDDSDRASKCEIYLDGELIGVEPSAATHGARLLLKLGYSPNTLMTTKSLFSEYPSWVPRRIGDWAETSCTEARDGRITIRPHRTLPDSV